MAMGLILTLVILSCNTKQKKPAESTKISIDSLTNSNKTSDSLGAVNSDNLDIPEFKIKLHKEEVVYGADSVALKGYLVYQEPDTIKRPGILIIHEWWGHNSYVRKRAEQLAELGYVSFAIDMYGNGKRAEHPGDAKKFAMNVMTNLPLARKRFEAALAELKKQPNVDTTRIAAIGYCFGGSVALTMANEGEALDAVAAFHSGLELPVMPGKDLKASVLICNGAADPLVSKESVTIYKRKLKAARADYKYIAYEGAKHSFTNMAADSIGIKFSLPMEYNAEADAKSWEELQNFLKKKLK